jgi:DNA-binding response OmpR family regulator
MTQATLPKHQVLVVEDELMIAMLLESILDANPECTVVGPYGRIELALEAAGNQPLDAALLDIHLADESVFPLANLLAERGVPFAFVTGYGKDVLPPVYRDRPVLQKPFRPQAVLATVAMMIGLPVTGSRE